MECEPSSLMTWPCDLFLPSPAPFFLTNSQFRRWGASERLFRAAAPWWHPTDPSRSNSTSSSYSSASACVGNGVQCWEGESLRAVLGRES
jgi:hypothetical protein